MFGSHEQDKWVQGQWAVKMYMLYSISMIDIAKVNGWPSTWPWSLRNIAWKRNKWLHQIFIDLDIISRPVKN